jgi:hypothetical protein
MYHLYGMLFNTSIVGDLEKLFFPGANLVLHRKNEILK